MNLKRKLASAVVATSLLAGGGIAFAAPAQAATSKHYWSGYQSTCEANLAAAMPGFGSFVRLIHGCERNGNGYEYEVLFL